MAVLLIASLVFYSYWNPPFVFLIFFSIVFNYFWGRKIQKGIKNPKETGITKKAWLYSGVAVNLALIGYFKYANFFMYNIASVGGWQWTGREIFLPLGISFFTFQQIAYLMDSSKEVIREHGFIQYALFVTFFPQLIAGPIVRYEQIIPQFSSQRFFVTNYRNIAIGFTLLSLGLFKKVVIADSLSPWVGAVYDSTVPFTFFEAWLGTLCYTFQIYFDFSGYSDMALGLGRLFNIQIPVNFNSPYKATSIVDFWRRWHITLSTFLRDYLYIPLGGNRKGKSRRYVNLMATMLLGGLWHGASWNFVLWGGLHGFFLCVNHGFRKISERFEFRVPDFLGWMITFLAVSLAWVFFRARSFLRAWDLLKGMAGYNGVALPSGFFSVPLVGDSLAFLGIDFSQPLTWTLSGGENAFYLVICCLLLCVGLPSSQYFAEKILERPKIYSAIVIGTIFLAGVFSMNKISEFLYFQF